MLRDADGLGPSSARLTRRVRPPSRPYLAALARLINDGQSGMIGRIYISEAAAETLARMRPDPNGAPIRELADICCVADLEGLLREVWPGLFSAGDQVTDATRR